LLRESETVDYFKKLKESIIKDSEIFSTVKFSKEMMIHLFVKNFNYFLGCCLRIFREALRFKLAKQQQFIDLTFVCRLYIISMRLNLPNPHEVVLLNHFFIKLWDES
jgi:hypothetical protein